MPNIKDILVDAKDKKLSIATCSQVLGNSEGEKGGANSLGHPLQHVFDVDGSLRRIKSKHFKRGPKLEEGSIVDDYNGYFKSLEQAAAYLKAVLESKAGTKALELLSETDWVISIVYGVGKKDEFYRGTLQKLSETQPNDNYYTYWEDSIQSIKLILHHKTGDELHVQSMYPQNKNFPSGAGEVIVRPDDKANPSPHHFCVFP